MTAVHAKLEEFERAVYCREREDRLTENLVAVVAMHQCLSMLRDGSGFENLVMDTDTITRMASAILALFCDPQFKVTQDGFDFIAADRMVIDTVFRASVYNGTDFIFTLIGDDTQHLNKYLLLFSVGSKLDLDLKEIFLNNPRETIGLWLSLVGYGQVLSREAHERRESLLELAPLFESVSIPDGLLNVLCSTYMHCSYASRTDKHAIKRVIHRMMARTMSAVTQPVFGVQVRKKRPKMLVVLEWWHSTHAMYRSYARSIKQLKRDFYVVGMKPGNDTDAESKAIFDEWVDLPDDGMVLSQTGELVKSIQADIIYYPSIGMSIWVIALASLRLAPLQVMTYGHPATSNSPVIDYGLIEADCYVPHCFSEKIIPLPNNVVRPSAFMPTKQRHVPRETSSVRIGVSAMQVKISWPFIQALQEVQRRAQKKVEVYFFSAAHGVGLYSLCREVGSMLDNTTVQEKQYYDEYMEYLHQMDIVLFSFPFGGANSMYDALTAGVPMVSMEGDEPHSRSDASIVRRAGLPESLIAHSVAEYVEIILRLMDDTERARIAGLVRAVDVEKRFYTPDESSAFVDAFKRIYDENTVEALSERAA